MAKIKRARKARRKPFKLIYLPDGRTLDEHATVNAFERYLGGRNRANQLWHVYETSYPTNAAGGRVRLTRQETFVLKAATAGFHIREVEAAIQLFS